nr:immunoglobulin light chain junction region [Macaca mulatta]MOY13209.1 immunoglobulin light chain junction region [Macaca mulatta]
CIQTLDFPWTF